MASENELRRTSHLGRGAPVVGARPGAGALSEGRGLNGYGGEIDRKESLFHYLIVSCSHSTVPFV